MKTTENGPETSPILLIEDSPFLEPILAAHFPIALYSTVDAALGAYQNTPLDFTLILISGTPQGQSPQALVSAFRDISPATEVVVFCKDKRLDLAVEVMKAGAYDFIYPPFTPSSLVAKMAILLRSAHSLKNIISSSQKTTPKPDAPTHRPHVLLVEDEHHYRILTTDLLSDHYRITSAGTAAEAVALYKADPSIDLVLLDIGLPDMNGDKVLEHLQAIRPCLFLILTAFRDIDLAVKTLRDGAIDFINKPFSEPLLLRTLQRIFQSTGPQTEMPQSAGLLALEKRYQETHQLTVEDILVHFPELDSPTLRSYTVIPDAWLAWGIKPFLDRLS
ncbi:MAG: response regulator [Candidatus Margulisiibacteriota bacterium]